MSNPPPQKAQTPSLKTLISNPASQIATPKITPETPLAHRAKSQAFLVFLILTAVSATWLLGFPLFQVSSEGSWSSLLGLLLAVSVVVGVLLWHIGLADVDLWSLVRVYGWYTLPGVAGLFLVFVLMQEGASGDAEV